MKSKLRIILLLALIVALLFGTSQIQRSLNLDRDRLGLTRIAPLQNAPPMLAFTTVALGGFRGLISNALWMRMSDLQDEDKFFEMMQLADWITKLEPRFVQVWTHQAWNMAYNVSVKFKDAPDRWRWVRAGIALLRDEALRYNPNEPQIYQQLGWLFQHKMGANLDDAHLYYKKMWRDEMSQVFKGPRPNFDELINPQTEDAKQRARLLTEKYKLDPKFMKEVDERYGPLEWRLPEAHAIYWAAYGLKIATQNERRINKEELLSLRRVIYQDMQLSFHRGRLIANPARDIDFGPNLDIIKHASEAYEQAIIDEEKARENIKVAYRNFLRDAVFFLYLYNREREAAQWYAYLAKKYPDKTLLENRPDSFPRNLTLDEYALDRVEEEVRDKSVDKTKAVLEGLVTTSFFSLAIGEDDRALVLDRMARRVWERYKQETTGAEIRVPLAPLGEIKKETLSRLLDPQRGLAPELREALAAKLNVPLPTNAPPPKISGEANATNGEVRQP